MAWTTPATVVTGDVIQASWANTHVRDNSRYLKGLDGPTGFSDDISVAGSVTTTGDADIAGDAYVAGAVGIGTDSPQAIFHIVEDSSGFSIARLSNTANGSNLKNWQLVIQSDGRIDFVSANDAWSEAIATAISLLHNGRVGIGTTTPSTILQVVGTLTATLFAGSGASLTNLPAGQLTGTIDNARLDSNVLLSSSSLNSAKLTGPVLATTQTILNDGTYTICAAADGGVFFLRDDVGNFAILYLFTGPLQTEISDPFNVFTFVSGTSSSWNLYVNGADILIQNKRGATRTIEIVRIAGG